MASKWVPGSRSTHLARRLWLRETQLQLPEIPPIYIARQKIPKDVNPKTWELDVFDGRRYSTNEPPSLLAAAFAAMSPGTFADYTPTAGMNFALIQGTSGHILEYASRGLYDPVHRLAKFLGGDHDGGQKELTFDEATDTWSSEASPFEGHQYHQYALDPATGDQYWAPWDDVALDMHRKVFGEDWDQIPDIPDRGSSVGCLEWHPGLGTEGGLVFADNGGIHTWIKGAGSWVTQATMDRGGWLHPFAAHLTDTVKLGGGDSATDASNLRWWNVADDGVDTIMSVNLPIAMGISGKGCVYPHPLDSTKLLEFGGAAGDTDIREYDSVEDEWTIIGTHSLVSNESGNWKSGFVIPGRGIMFLQTTGANLTCKLYKAA